MITNMTTEAKIWVILGTLAAFLTTGMIFLMVAVIRAIQVVFWLLSLVVYSNQ